MEANKERLQRIIQESVPGKQVTLAHVIASPANEVNERIGVDVGESIGILTITPTETAIIAADIAAKAAAVSIGFVDRFNGSVVILGDVQSVEYSLQEVVDVFERKLGFSVVKVTKT